MTCREFIENYEIIKECGDMWQYFKDLKKKDPEQYEIEIETHKKKEKELWDRVNNTKHNLKDAIKRLKNRTDIKKKDFDINEQTAQVNALNTAQQFNTQGSNSFMRRGYDYKITGQFKNSELGSITNQGSPDKEDENPSLDITTHDYVLVKLHSQKMVLRIVMIMGNEYVGKDNQNKEYKFDKSQIMRKINV